MISLFSGAMGLDLGMEAAGFSCAGCLEIDKRACETIRINRPEIPLIEGDIKDWNNGGKLLSFFGLKDSDVNVMVGGPPCPSFSTAGKRQAFNDPRGQVMFDFLKLVDEIRPSFFVMENVRGILSAALEHIPLAERNKCTSCFGKGTVMSLLNQQFEKMGYTVTAQLVNAADYGTPQKRERVVFLGSRDGYQLVMPVGSYGPEETLFQQRWRTLGDAIDNLHDKKPEFTPFSPSRIRFLSLLKEGQNWRDLPLEMQREALGGAYESTGGRVGFYRRLTLKKPSPTVSTSPIQKSTCLCHPTELRPLSVKEYARIQQFPDEWIFSGTTSDKYRQIGNAVPIGLGYVIGKTVMNHIENLEEIE
ncbi:MAG TPA: DNA (cytosine-5-)-methyltransferase [Lentisphaeria bacterium]|nr:MAG: hypothetical protein A2X48_05690 [Lentisphaerae bacterium GWF2_49_21]HBC86545.1 DNA (cytosine-5-)-methyltransferase [Lentisphaeria bacterium]